jgi:hypothetical protein
VQALSGEDTETKSFKVFFGAWPGAALCFQRLLYAPKRNDR